MNDIPALIETESRSRASGGPGHVQDFEEHSIEISRGGFGIVYFMCLDGGSGSSDLENCAAVKLDARLVEGGAADAATQQRARTAFEREASIHAELSGACEGKVVPCFSETGCLVRNEKGVPLLALQYFSQGNLRDFIDESALPEVPRSNSAEDEAFAATEVVGAGPAPRAEVLRNANLQPLSVTLQLAAQLAEALACVADHGYVHHDVKPQNVLINWGPKPGSRRYWLTDFGAAQRASVAAGDDDERWIGCHSAQMTYLYAPPEYVTRHSTLGPPCLPPTSAYDMWSLAATAMDSLFRKDGWAEDARCLSSQERADSCRRHSKLAPHLSDGNFRVARALEYCVTSATSPQWLEARCAYLAEKRNGAGLGRGYWGAKDACAREKEFYADILNTRSFVPRRFSQPGFTRGPLDHRNEADMLYAFFAAAFRPPELRVQSFETALKILHGQWGEIVGQEWETETYAAKMSRWKEVNKPPRLPWSACDDEERKAAEFARNELVNLSKHVLDGKVEQLATMITELLKGSPWSPDLRKHAAAFAGRNLWQDHQVWQDPFWENGKPPMERYTDLYYRPVPPDTSSRLLKLSQDGEKSSAQDFDQWSKELLSVIDTLPNTSRPIGYDIAGVRRLCKRWSGLPGYNILEQGHAKSLCSSRTVPDTLVKNVAYVLKVAAQRRQHAQAQAQAQVQQAQAQQAQAQQAQAQQAQAQLRAHSTPSQTTGSVAEDVQAEPPAVAAAQVKPSLRAGSNGGGGAAATAKARRSQRRRGNGGGFLQCLGCGQKNQDGGDDLSPRGQTIRHG
jgi:serine/threonine protein kinase